MEGPAVAQFEKLLQQVIDQAVRAGKVVRRMRTFTRRTRTSLVACSLSELVQEVMGLLAGDLNTQGIHWGIESESTEFQVQADPIQTQQVLINLVRNAIDALREIPSEKRWIRTTLSAAKDEPGMVLISVSNSGAAIEETIRDEIFEPYVSSKPDGLGLGLPICRTIIEMQGGKLWLASGPNEPTEFRFTLRSANSSVIEDQ